MRVINIDDIHGREIKTPGVTRVVKQILVTKRMATHLAIIPPSQSTSEHSHPMSEEIVYVVSGTGNVKVGEETREYKRNHLVFIPEGSPHQYRNTGAEDLVLFVVYSPAVESPKEHTPLEIT